MIPGTMSDKTPDKLYYSITSHANKFANFYKMQSDPRKYRLPE